MAAIKILLILVSGLAAGFLFELLVIEIPLRSYLPSALSGFLSLLSMAVGAVIAIKWWMRRQAQR